jgi:HSP20 family protein
MKVWEIGRSVGNHIAESVGRVASQVQESRPLAADLLESDDAYLAVFDAPGVSGGDVQVRFANGEVLVRLERFREFYDEFEMRLPGRGLSLDGHVRLPDGAAIDPEGATATLKDSGTLHVLIPKDDEDGVAVGIDEQVESLEADIADEIEEPDTKEDIDVGGPDTDESDDPVGNPTPS